LERAYAQRDGGLSEKKGDPLLKNLERDPRYAALPQEDAPACVSIWPTSPLLRGPAGF
jgi:hypothetical protein